MMDRTTKVLLFAIALGLWMNVASDWLRPTPVRAPNAIREALGDPQLNRIAGHVRDISIDTAAMRVTLDSIAIRNSLRR